MLSKEGEDDEIGLISLPCNPERNKQELRQIPRTHFFLEWLCDRARVLNQAIQA